jgi:hypothetical protein
MGGAENNLGGQMPPPPGAATVFFGDLDQSDALVKLLMAGLKVEW